MSRGVPWSLLFRLTLYPPPSAKVLLELGTLPAELRQTSGRPPADFRQTSGRPPGSIASSLGSGAFLRPPRVGFSASAGFSASTGLSTFLAPRVAFSGTGTSTFTGLSAFLVPGVALVAGVS